MSIVVAALYQFVGLDNFKDMRAPLLEKMRACGVKGSLLLAQEGINGTVAGSRAGVDALLAYLKSDERLGHLEHKESLTDEMPFDRCKVKFKKEIVTLGVDGIDPTATVGEYVQPEDWNDLIRDPDVVLVDTRNDYEHEIGTFKGAIDPRTQKFRDFPEYVDKNLDPQTDKKVALFCTGGIRCEKATGYLLQRGFEKVYHLKGGILKYLEAIPEDRSLWQGDCYVFDRRVAVNHHLEKSDYESCYACGRPITEEDKQSEFYIEGVQCARCHDVMSEAQKARFAERQRQMELAAERQQKHLGN